MNLARYFGCALLAAGLTACGVPGIPKPPSLNLPQPVTDLRAVRKGDHVYLVWSYPTQTTDSLADRHLGVTRICRNLGATITDCTTSVGQVAAPTLPAAPTRTGSKAIPKMQGTYTDTLPKTLLSNDPAAQMFYAVSVMNENGRSAGLSNLETVPAVAGLPVPADFQAQITAEGVVLSWTEVPHAAEIPAWRHIYRVYRREDGGEADTVAGEMPLETASPLQFVDHSFEWEKTYRYRVTVVTVIHVNGKPEMQFEGDDSAPVKVFAHDTFPPAVPSGLQAVFSGAGQQPFIDLIWAPDTDADLAGYNIYRHEEGAEPKKINSQLVKAPAWRDADVTPGHAYFYSVSAVDVRGNESELSGEARETVP